MAAAVRAYTARRAAAGMNLLAKADLVPGTSAGLRPEQVGAGAVSPAITNPSISFFSMPVLSATFKIA